MKKKGSDPKRESKKLKKELRKTKKALRETKMELERVKQEMEKTKRDFEEYKVRHPETVGVKHGKPYFIKSTTKSKRPKKPGAKKGHKPFFRKMPAQVGEIQYVPVGICPCCGSNSLSDVQEERTRTVEDIPVCTPVVIKYIIQRRYCRECKKMVESPVPSGFTQCQNRSAGHAYGCLS